MWPRLDTGQLATTGGRKLGGFVAYLRRPDAERAAKEMDGAEWGDNVLKIGWGKAVPLPATAIYGECRPLRLRTPGLTKLDPQNLTPTRPTTASAAPAHTRTLTPVTTANPAHGLARARSRRTTLTSSSARSTDDPLAHLDQRERAHGRNWRKACRRASW